MHAFILTIILATGYSASSITMQEFNNQQKCESIKNEIISIYANSWDRWMIKRIWCTEK